MSATRRGFILFGILVVVVPYSVCGCRLLRLPHAGWGWACRQISLPPEVLARNGFLFGLGLDLTNTFTTLILIDVIVLLMGWRREARVSSVSRLTGWSRASFTNFIDLLVEFWYNQARLVLGEHTAAYCRWR